jgi:GNAT superfamily N-acetyltransferase
MRVRPATAADAALIHGFIRDLAEYEKLLDEVTGTPDDIARDLFGPNPRVFCDIAEDGGEAVGFAVWFYNYSTFWGRHGIYLEDLFVRPQARGKGAGKALLAGLARRCVDEGLKSLDWAVLNWNAPSIAFYDSLGAETMDDWIMRSLHGEALARMAMR